MARLPLMAAALGGFSLACILVVTLVFTGGAVPPAHAATAGTCSQWEYAYVQRADSLKFECVDNVQVDEKGAFVPEYGKKFCPTKLPVGWEPMGDVTSTPFMMVKRCVK